MMTPHHKKPERSPDSRCGDNTQEFVDDDVEEARFLREQERLEQQRRGDGQNGD